MSKHEDMLLKLIHRGDKVSVVKGRLQIARSTGKIVAPAEFAKYERLLLVQISKIMGLCIFEFTDYSVGLVLGQSQSKLTLNFMDIQTGELVRTYFNVSTKRSRTTSSGNAGDRLPEGKFIVRKRHKLVRLWRKWELPEPEKLSLYASKMGALKKIYFTGDLVTAKEGLRFDRDSIMPLQLDHQTLCETANKKIGELTPSISQPINKTIPKTNQFLTKNLNQESNATSVLTPPSARSNCVSNFARLKDGVQSTANEDNPKPPEQQSTDEWLDDYGEID